MKTALTALLLLAATAVTAQVRVNQVAYYPAGPKLATIEATKPRAFTLSDRNGRTVYKGRTTTTAASAFTAAPCQTADFSAFKKEGRYLLRCGRDTVTVTIAAHALRPMAEAALHAFYLNRSGQAITGPYARPAAHMDTCVLVHPTAASPARPAGTRISSPGGWYDAGDYNKYIVNSAYSLGVLLHSAPESDALLAECRYNLDWMLTMQDPSDGGLYHKLTTPAFEGFIMPKDCKQPRYVVQKTTTAALDFAACMALASRVYGRHAEHKAFACKALAAARRAWAWAVANPNVLYDQTGNNKRYEPKVTTGEYGDTSVRDEFYWAATELYLTTGEPGYDDTARLFAPEAVTLGSWDHVATLALLARLSFAADAANTGAASTACHTTNSTACQKAGCTTVTESPCARRVSGEKLTTFCDSLVALAARAPYRCSHGNAATDFMWGSNSEHCAGEGLLLLAQYRQTGDTRYRDAALMCADWLLGRNATGYCFVTGFGQKRVLHPHQRLSEADGIDAPMPGFLVGGPNKGRQDAEHCPPYPSTRPDLSYQDNMGSYASNEIAINWNATLLALLSSLDAAY